MGSVLDICFWSVSGDIIKKLKENGYEYTWGNVTVKLAEAYGFCWGVERAVQIAYEARKQFPTERIWITNDIIHNPTVNQVLVYFSNLFLDMRPFITLLIVCLSRFVIFLFFTLCFF